MQRGLGFWLVTQLLIASGCTCNDRAVMNDDDQPPPEERQIDKVCADYCAELMECVHADLTSPAFDTQEGCLANCVNDEQWDRSCAGRQYAVFECFTQYECPDFQQFWTNLEESPCFEQSKAYSSCFGTTE